MSKADKDHTTEERIKEAAREVFTEKGFAAARTRDIAERAGINLALLNYYFRSKENLFNIIMLENLHQFFSGLKGVLNDETSSLEAKIESIASNYIDLLMKQPNLPLFIMMEIRNEPQKLVEKMGIRDVLKNSYFMKQFSMAARENKPLHLLMNLMALIIFPFIARPIIQNVVDVDNTEYIQLMQERKKLIPRWVKALLRNG
jgi:Transcriptional regulator